MSQSARDVQLTELKDMISQLNMTVTSQSKTMEAMTSMLAEKDQRIAELTEELRLLRQKLFGYSKERTAFTPNSDQINMLVELGLEPEPEPELVDVEFIDVKAHKKTRKNKATFEEQFKGLRVKQIVVDTLSEEDKLCPVCGTGMKPIGTEHIRYDIVHVRPDMYAIEYLATTYECPKCKDTEDPQFIKDEGAPPALIEHSYLTPSLAAWVFYQKFALAVPYYRLEKSFEELGGPINRTTMANWSIQCFEMYYAPMYDFFHRQLLKRQFLMMCILRSSTAGFAEQNGLDAEPAAA